MKVYLTTVTDRDRQRPQDSQTLRLEDGQTDRQTDPSDSFNCGTFAEQDAAASLAHGCVQLDLRTRIQHHRGIRRLGHVNDTETVDELSVESC